MGRPSLHSLSKRISHLSKWIDRDPFLMLVATAKKTCVVFEMFPPWPWLFGRITNGGLSSDGGELRARDLWCRPRR